MKHRCVLLIAAALLCAGVALAENECKHTPVIYCSDLFHPHDDPDDHFDLACMYAISEFDIQAIILDQGEKQVQKPGKTPVAQMNALTGRNVPYAIGLGAPLAHPEDAGENQADAFQAGIRLMLDVLRNAPEPVTIIAVGSMRDVAAAFNRQPELFREKVARLLLFIGDAQGKFTEYNVGLDVHAYRRLMQSDLPIYWVPCFDGGLWVNEGNASFWQSPHRALLEGLPDTLVNFFIYALLHKQAADPVAALSETPVSEEKERVLAETRNLWCSAVFPWAAGRKYVLRNGAYRCVPAHALLPGETTHEVFSFKPMGLCVDEQGKESYGETCNANTVQRFHVQDLNAYPRQMTEVTHGLLQELGNALQKPAQP